MSDLQNDGQFELRFTNDEADLILTETLVDDEAAEQLRNKTPACVGGFVVVATLATLDDLLCSIAAAANHCEVPDIVAGLERLYERLEKVERVQTLMAKLAGKAPALRPRPATRSEKGYIFQLRIELLGVEPPIWRRIQISSSASFWDLHVAIQDAMGWKDRHLHDFVFLQTMDRVGIPLDDDALGIVPGWERHVELYLAEHSPLALYQYDFGDSWLHEVRFEKVAPMVARRKYPRCLAGERQCPPEDCGGPARYAEFLKAISDPKHPEHDSFVEWIGGPFDPEAFDAKKVRFSNSKERLQRLLNSDTREGS